MSKLGALLASLVMGVVLWATPVQATIWFDSGFEVPFNCVPGAEGPVNSEGWTYQSQLSNCISPIVQNSVVFPDGGASSVAIKLGVNGCPEPCGKGPANQFYQGHPNTTHIFQRIYVKTTSDWQAQSISNQEKIWFVDNSVGSGMRPIVGDNFSLWAINFQAVFDNGTYNGANDLFLPQFHFATLMYANVPVRNTNWRLLELEIQINTPGQANGLANMWMDGVLVAHTHGRQFVGPNTSSLDPVNGSPVRSDTSFNFMTFFTQDATGAAGTMYIDRAASGDQRIGGALAPDTTPPTVPTSLTAAAISAIAFLMILGGIYGRSHITNIPVHSITARPDIPGAETLRTVAVWKPVTKDGAVYVVDMENGKRGNPPLFLDGPKTDTDDTPRT